MRALATFYRPKTFSEVVSQSSIIKILTKQLELKQFKNCIVFAGPSGCGKTTIARILANEINGGLGSPIEIDAASNNGVDCIRNLIEESKERALDSEYKIIILDECHALSNSAWQSLLKIIEEPPKYTIFMFCTTESQKIPQTILNRVQLFNLSKIPTLEIKNRLEIICKQENFTNYEESIDYISKISDGCMRMAISNLEKVAGLSSNITINNTLEVLGNFSYEKMFTLTNGIIDGDEALLIEIIDAYYNNGRDLKVFIENYLEFIFDLLKFIIFKDFNVIKIPKFFEDSLKYTIGIENNKQYFNKFVDSLLEIKRSIKYDSNIKTTIEIMLLAFLRGE